MENCFQKKKKQLSIVSMCVYVSVSLISSHNVRDLHNCNINKVLCISIAMEIHCTHS